MNYKIGDKVKITNCSACSTYSKESCLGKLFTINSINEYGGGETIYHAPKNYYMKQIPHDPWYRASEIKLLKGGEQHMTYLVCWTEADGNDPWELVEDLDEATEKVEELLDNDVDEGDIRVFAVSKELDIEAKGVTLK